MGVSGFKISGRPGGERESERGERERRETTGYEPFEIERERERSRHTLGSTRIDETINLPPAPEGDTFKNNYFA